MHSFYKLKIKAKLEIYKYIDENIRPLPKDKYELANWHEKFLV